MQPDPQRCFIALAPDAATRKRLAAWPTPPGGMPLAAPDLHLTIAFLGALKPAQVDALRQALRPLARPLPALAFDGIAYWPAPEHPRVMVAGFALAGELRARVEAVQAILHAQGLPVEHRPYRPHVTLARFRSGPAAMEPAPAPGAVAPAVFTALGLYCRAPSDTGLRYASLFEFPLA